MINVTNEITIYEINGKEQRDLNMPKLLVKNHWADSNKVVLIFPEEKTEITVLAKDLFSSIENATNTSRY